MAIIVNNFNGSKIDVSEDGNGNTVINITSTDIITSSDVRDEIKKTFEQLSNPNSYPSKMLNRAVRAPRRG